MAMNNKGSRTRWGSGSATSKLTGLTLSITGPMIREQIETYAQLVRIEEITQKLKIDDIVPTDWHSRSPSPGPIYDNAGRRLNTRSLANMNAQPRANIVIRERESTKEGRRGPQKVDEARKLVETVTTTPEHANECKREQLRELARVNGTFRDDEGHGLIMSTITNHKISS
ncbi:hypothetical protein F4805DRAFT_461612 [Annulohypoxylon moriforme]|nr:hypothetical protein F4805DRAFT_461612 [Annulohypoxylon moriforme]